MNQPVTREFVFQPAFRCTLSVSLFFCFLWRVYLNTSSCSRGEVALLLNNICVVIFASLSSFLSAEHMINTKAVIHAVMNHVQCTPTSHGNKEKSKKVKRKDGTHKGTLDDRVSTDTDQRDKSTLPKVSSASFQEKNT